jgi:hypothetical protein
VEVTTCRLPKLSIDAHLLGNSITGAFDLQGTINSLGLNEHEQTLRQYSVT